MNSLKIEGREYPCRVTMGAMMRFKQETGKDIQAMESTDTADVLTFLWCCIVSACRVDGVEFTLSALDMADRMSAEDFAAWQGDAFESPVPQTHAKGKKKQL
jgi:hypothetical protein